VTPEERVRASFARQAFMRTLGAEIVHVDDGVVEIELARDERLTQQHGFLHAGVVAAVVDSACGYAALTRMDDDAAVLTVEYKINLLAPAAGESFLARGEVLRSGRTITVCRGELRSGERLVAAMTATVMAVRGRGLED
jgi:uncharacterized protein (TIGR00369 family)